MTLESSKNLGGIGAILLLVGAIGFFFSPYVLAALGLVGTILILVALHGLANFYREGSIFNNALYGVIVAIVGIVIAGVIVFAVVLSNITALIDQFYPGWNGDWASLAGMTPNTTNIDYTALIPFITGLAAVWVVMWIFAIVFSFLVRRSLKAVTAKSTVNMFGTAGLLLLIGGLLTVIFIGWALMWIAALLLAVAFFQLKPQEQAPSMAPVTYPPPPTPV